MTTSSASVFNKIPYKKIMENTSGETRKVGTPNLKWIDGVAQYTTYLKIRNWSFAKNGDGWPRILREPALGFGADYDDMYQS